MTFNPFMTVKDVHGALVFFLLFALVLFFAPNYLGHPDNYVPADPLATPAHIVPEWYFLPFYAILRAIPDKLLGVVAMVASIGLLAFLPWLDRSPVRSSIFRPVWNWLTLGLVADFFVLMWVGAMPAEGVYIWIARIATLYWFAYFLVLAPVVGILEKPHRLPRDIHEFQEMKRRGEIGFLTFPSPRPDRARGTEQPAPAPTE